MINWNEIEREFEKAFARDITGLCVYADVRDIKFFLKETVEKAERRGAERAVAYLREVGEPATDKLWYVTESALEAAKKEV